MELSNIENVIGEFIKENKKPSYLTTNKKEISIRCPYCGDSRKNKSSTHLYIELRSPFKFYCHKCNTGGVLNNQTLRDFGIFNQDIATAISAHKTKLKFKNLNLSTQTRKFKQPELVVVESESSKKAVEYFNQRYNSNYDNDYIVNKFKAITDADEFFKKNNIKPNGFYNFKDAIGFLSSDGTHIVFRDISGKAKTRYFNLNLDQSENETSNKIYNLRSSIDILQEKITLVITEGIFDIIGVYEHFYKGTENEKNTIFAAACGKSYNAVILNYIRKGFLDLDIKIYSDNDVPITFLKDIKNASIYQKNLSIEVFYNKKEKDFGVPKDQIELQRARI